MILTYDNLDAAELRGDDISDYLISIEAKLRIEDEDQVVLEEASFPVVELARSLARWLDDAERGDFQFESISIEDVGVVAITKIYDSWRVSSAWSPASPSRLLQWATIEQMVSQFLDQVDRDLESLGIDSRRVLRV